MPPAADLLRAALAAPHGPHPAADTLRQYAAGALAPAQQHQVEAHALDCPRCADVLAGLAQTDAAATDQALAALRHRLHARMAAEAAPRPAAAGWHWPRLAAAAALVAGLAGSGLWGWQHRTAPTEVTTTAAPPAASSAAESSAAELARAPAPPPTVATAPAASAPTVATAKPRPATVIAYEPRRRATKKSTLPRADHEEVAVLNSSALDAVAAKAPAPAAMMAAAPKAAADSVAAPPSEIALSQSQRPAPAARALMGRVAGVAVVPTMPTESTAVAQRMTFVAPANSAAMSAMPAAPALAPTPAGGLAPLRDQLRRAAAEFVPDETPLKGNVRVRFTVGSDGKLSNLKVVRGLRADYDAEALRLVCEGPGWVPGVVGGRRAPLPVELDVVF